MRSTAVNGSIIVPPHGSILLPGNPDLCDLGTAVDGDDLDLPLLLSGVIVDLLPFVDSEPDVGGDDLEMLENRIVGQVVYEPLLKGPQVLEYKPLIRHRFTNRILETVPPELFKIGIGHDYRTLVVMIVVVVGDIGRVQHVLVETEVLLTSDAQPDRE